MNNNSTKHILAQLQYSSYICLGNYCDARSLNLHLLEDYSCPNINIERSGNAEGIESADSQYLSMMSTTPYGIQQVFNMQIR